MKVFITGPPCSGKSHYAEKLAKHYNVPHIHMKKLLADLLEWDEEKEKRYRLAETKANDMKTTIRERKAAKQALKESETEERLRLEAEAKKAKEAELGEDGEPVEEPPAEDEEAKEEGAEGKESGDLDIPVVEDSDGEKSTDIAIEADSDDDFQPISIKDRIRDFVKGTGLIDRIPEVVINEAVRWRLERNDCQNRGYILDGYPKCLKNAKDVFMHTPIPPEPQYEVDPDSGEKTVTNQEELDNWKEKPSLYKHIFPESVVSLRATEQFIKRRAKATIKAQAHEHEKWAEDKLIEKMKQYG